MIALSVFLHSAVVLMCLIGCVHPAYRDNCIQRCAMVVIALASAGKALQAVFLGHASPSTVMLAAGLLLFAMGIAAKVVKYR